MSSKCNVDFQMWYVRTKGNVYYGYVVARIAKIKTHTDDFSEYANRERAIYEWQLCFHCRIYICTSIIYSCILD